MPQIINTNIASINAQRNLDKSQSANQTALQRLSSGLRINSAKDDAAGLAISTRFTSQIKGLNVAVRNAGDGIALAQTAEGALGSINENLQRIRELAVQSANATNSDVDREALQAEVDQLVAEITRTADETDFNGRKLLDGSFSATFQIGANAGQTVDVSIAELTADKLGASSQSGLSARGTGEALENGDLVINGVAIAASRAEDDTSSVDNNAASAISKAAAINRYSDETGVTAMVNENVAGGSSMSGIAGTGTFTLNGVEISFSTTTDTAQSRAAITQAINAVAEQTGVSAVDTDNASTGVNLVAEDGRNITLTFDTADLSSGFGATAAEKASNFALATGLAGGAVDVDGGGAGTVYSNTYEGGYTLIADGDQKTIEISGGNGTGRGDLANAGLTAGTYDRAEAVSVSTKVAATSEASTNAGGTLNNNLESSNLAGTFVSSNVSKVGTNLAAITYTAGGVSFTVSEGTTAAVNYAATAGATSVSAMADLLETQATTAGMAVDFFELGQITAAGFTDGTSFQLGGVSIAATGTSATALAESVMNQINSSNFAAAVGADGFVRAELNSAGDSVSITFKNQNTSPLTAFNLSNGSAVAAVTFDASGAAIALAVTTATPSAIQGELAFTSSSEITVVATDTGTTLTGSAGSNSYVGATSKVLSSSNETNISIAFDGEDVAVAGSPLAAGSSVSQLAAAVNAVDGVSAYEEIELNVNSTNLDVGEGLRFTGGNGTAITISATPDSSGNVTLASLADDINKGDFSTANMDVSAVYDATANSGAGGITLTIRNYDASAVQLDSENADGAGIVVSEGGSTFIGEQKQTLSGELKFFSDDGRDVSVTLSDPTTGGELFAGKSSAASYTGVNGLQDGDVLINGVTIGGAEVSADTASATVSSDGSKILSSEKEQSAIAIAAAINKVSEETGVTATVNATEVVGGDGTNVDLTQFEEGDQAGIYINGVEVGTVTLQKDGSGNLDADRARADALNLINQNSGKTGVTAVDNGVSLTMTAADGRNVSIAIDDKSGSSASIGAVMGLDAAVDGIGESTFGAGSAAGATTAEGSTYETTYGTVKLSSAKEFTLEGGANGNTELDAMGLSVGTYGGGEDGQFLKDIDISTFEGAQAAITAIDNAIGQVASQRADLGAIQNRMESTVSNLKITSENLNAANSRIQDADFAAETAEMSRTQVLQQAGISVLAQANAAGQQVLSLLG